MSPLRKSTQKPASKSSKVSQPQDFHRTGPLEEILTPSPLFPTDDLEDLGFSETGDAGGSSESFDTVVVEDLTGDANTDESSEVLEAINVDSDPDDGLDLADLDTDESAGEDLDDPIVVITELDDEDLDDLDGNEIEATITDDSEISEVVEAADVTETLGKVDPVETIEAEDTSEAVVTAADVTSKVTEDADTDSEVGSDGELELGVESKTDADLNEDTLPVETQTEANATTGEALGGDPSVEVTVESDPDAVAAGDDASIEDLTSEPLDDDGVSDAIDGEASAEDGDADTDEEFEEILEEIVESAGFTLDLSAIDAGIFTVGSDGLVGIDFLYDGGAYKGQLAIFSLEGLDDREFESFDDFIAETVDRASSNSDRGYLVINDKTEGAKFASGENSGDYRGVKLFAMKAGDTFAVMLVPNSTLDAAADGESTSVMVRPLYSLSTANPDDELHVAQIADVTGDGSTFVLEDKSTENNTDRDYNDIIFQVRGAKGKAEYVGNVVEGNFFETDMGKAIRAYASPYVTPEAEPIVVDDAAALLDETISDDSDVETTTDELDVNETTKADPNNSDLSELIDFDEGNESEIVDDVRQVLDATGSDESESELLPEWLFEPRDTVFAVPDIPDAPIANQPLIGIIDTGFAVNNPDINYENITLGTDFVDGDANPLLVEGEGSEHGTHVLGIIAAEQDNGEGIDGINDDAPIWLGRAIGSGKWADSLVEFVNHAIESEQPNAVVNLSLDLTQIDANGNVTTRYELTPTERAAIEYARQSNVLLVVGAGNDGGVMSALGQASQEFDNIITVGAAERVGEEFADAKAFDRAGYSSYGRGLNIVASGGTVENPELSLTGDGVGTMAGTSVATAKVTGAISQVWAANPELSYRQVIEIVKDTATDLGRVDFDNETGAGLLNQTAAVLLAKVTVPEVHFAPSSVIPDSWSGQETYAPGERSVKTEFYGKYYEWTPYTIQYGDTLSGIAQRTMGSGTSTYYNFIAQKNGIANPNYINAGAQILVPYEVAPPAPSVNLNNTVGFDGASAHQTYINTFNRNGGSGQLGSPTNNVHPWGNGYTQDFSGGSEGHGAIMKSNVNDLSYWVGGSFWDTFLGAEGAGGLLKYPTSDRYGTNGGARQNFQGGAIIGSSHGTYTLYGGIGAHYLQSEGGEKGRLGFPTGRETGIGNGVIVQHFENGRIVFGDGPTRTEMMGGATPPVVTPPVSPPYSTVQNPILSKVDASYFNARPQYYTSGNIFAQSMYGSSLVGGRGYTEGNCTWYAHGRLLELGGNKAALQSMRGNANQWHTQISNGTQVVSSPRPGDIAQWTSNGANHVAVVEKVNADGTIVISESHYNTNWDGGGAGTLHHVRTISASNPDRFIRVPGVEVNNQNGYSTQPVVGNTFTGRVIATAGANLRSGPGTSHGVASTANYGAMLTFDQVATGEFVVVPGFGASDQWYRVAGTNQWISATLVHGSPSNPVNDGAATPGEEMQYIVKAGDTLWDIARRYLGDGNRWREIRKSPGGSGFTEEEARYLQIGQSVYIPVSYPTQLPDNDFSDGNPNNPVEDDDSSSEDATQPIPEPTPIDPEKQRTKISQSLNFKVENFDLLDLEILGVPLSGNGFDFDSQITFKPEQSWDLPLGMEAAIEALVEAKAYLFLSSGTGDIGFSGDFNIVQDYDPLTNSSIINIESVGIGSDLPYLSTYLGFGAGFGASTNVKASLKKIPAYGDLSIEVGNGFNVTAEEIAAFLLAPGASNFGSLDTGFNLNTNLWADNTLKADDTAGVKVDATEFLKKAGDKFSDAFTLGVEAALKQSSEAKLEGFYFDPDNDFGNNNHVFVDIDNGFGSISVPFAVEALRIMPKLSVDTSFFGLLKGSAEVGVSKLIEGVLGDSGVGGFVAGKILGGLPPKIGIAREVEIPIPFAVASVDPFANQWETVSFA